MNPLDTIEKWISEHGSAAILRDHVALLKEQMAAKDAKIIELETLHKQAQAKLDDFNIKTNRFADEQPADKCPFCNRNTGQLVEIKPSPNPHFAMMGFKQRYYKCSNPSCGKNYDNSANPEE
jgi:hypothetical protein